jgi:hypothetical protein
VRTARTASTRSRTRPELRGEQLLDRVEVVGEVEQLNVAMGLRPHAPAVVRASYPGEQDDLGGDVRVFDLDAKRNGRLPVARSVNASASASNGLASALASKARILCSMLSFVDIGPF